MATATSRPADALTIDGLSKNFGGTRALDQVGLRVATGEFHALVGGNGSGKSTLIKVLAGVHRADAGSVRVGTAEHFASRITPRWTHKAGVRFVHQDLGMFDDLSVAENVFIGDALPRTRGVVDWPTLYRRAQSVLDALEVDVSPRSKVGSLRPAEATDVALARCLRDRDGEDVRLLVLDEPTARLPVEESAQLLARLRRYAAAGQSILYVSHRLDEILDHADTVSALRDGQHVLTDQMRNLSAADLARAIVGDERGILEDRPPRSVPSGEPVLRVSTLSGGPLADVDLTVAPGEVVGIVGLVGSGRTSLLENIYGSRRRARGEVRVGGRQIRAGRVDAAIRAGLVYVPEDRAAHAVFDSLDVAQNLAAGTLREVRDWWGYRHDWEQDAAVHDIARITIRTPGPRALMSSLSGGNQQKVILARWLRAQPLVLLLDEPSQGIDVGARTEIYQHIETAVEQGAGVVLVSSDLDELLHLSDRVLALDRGQVTAHVDAQDISQGWIAEHLFTAGDKEAS